MAFGLFKRKNKENKETNRYFTLRVREVIAIAKDAVNVVFETPDPSFHYEPGQFLTLIETINGQKIRRAYSLCTAPGIDEFPAVTVKRVEGGVMSNYVNDTFQAGREVEVMEPMGKFIRQPNASKQVVLIGGGSGITPLMALIKSIMYQESETSVMLVYANRSEEYIIFKDLLGSYEAQFQDRFQVVHLLEEDLNGFAKIKGRLSQGILQDLMTDWMAAEFFICGPKPMMDIAAKGLAQMGVDPAKVRMESFDTVTSTQKDDKVASGASEVKIHLDGEEYTIQVPMNRSILETALDNGLDMPYSCQSGLCTACRGKCLDGEISTDDAEGLSQEELNEGYRLLCVGKPLSDKLEIKVG